MVSRASAFLPAAAAFRYSAWASISTHITPSFISFAEEVKQYGMDLTWIESIQLLFELMEYEPEMIDALRSDLLQLYLYTGLGVVVFLASKAKSFKK